MTKRNCNLLFQGGRVRGIAYAGALDAMPSNMDVVCVAGTSAGALVAALVAKGYKGKELKELLGDPELTRLLDEVDVDRWERLVKAFKGSPIRWPPSITS
jgi:NTE family protein